MRDRSKYIIRSCGQDVEMLRLAELSSLSIMITDNNN